MRLGGTRSPKSVAIVSVRRADETYTIRRWERGNWVWVIAPRCYTARSRTADLNSEVVGGYRSIEAWRARDQQGGRWSMPAAPLPAGPDTLPAQLTSFIGRERELEELVALLASVRLLTLTGPG